MKNSYFMFVPKTSKTEENVSLISKNITQFDIKLAPTVDGVSTIC